MVPSFKASVIVVLALLLAAALSTHSSAPESAPSPAPTAAAGAISPSFAYACVAAVPALVFGYGLKI